MKNTGFEPISHLLGLLVKGKWKAVNFTGGVGLSGADTFGGIRIHF